MGWIDFESIKNIAGDHAKRAFELDDQDAWVHISLGYMHFMNRDSEEAIAELTNAVQLSPNSAAAYGWRGWAKAHAGLSMDAIADTDMAMRLSPKDPLKPIYVASKAVSYFMADQFERSVELADEIIRLRPGLVGAYRLRCTALARAGRIAEAREALAIVNEIQPDVSASRLRRILPYPTPEKLEKFVGGLVLAGLPNDS